MSYRYIAAAGTLATASAIAAFALGSAAAQDSVAGPATEAGA